MSIFKRLKYFGKNRRVKRAVKQFRGFDEMYGYISKNDAKRIGRDKGYFK